MTYDQILSQISTPLGLINADARLTNKFYYFLFQKHTGWLLKQESDKMLLYASDDIWQTLDCVDLIELPATDSCCKYQGASCTIYRTRIKMPTIYEDAFGVMVKTVTSIDYSESLVYIKYQEWIRKQNNPDRKYDRKKYFFYKDGYFYFPNINWKLVSITAYFKDDISYLNLCEKQTKCKDLFGTSCRIPSYLEGRVVDACIKELSETIMRVQPDTQIDKNELNKR